MGVDTVTVKEPEVVHRRGANLILVRGAIPGNRTASFASA